jgi:hypothetical protein
MEAWRHGAAVLCVPGAAVELSGGPTPACQHPPTPQAAKLRGVLQASVKVVGVANSRQMLVDPDGLDTGDVDWKALLAAKVRAAWSS